MKQKYTVKGNVKVFCETIDFDSLPDKDFISKFIKENPFDFKKGIIAHCRTLDKYDVYQWVADDEVKIRNLLEEKQQLKEKLEKERKVRKEALDLIEKLRFEKWAITGTDIMDVIDILDIDKGA